jgi:hypothetical protein
VRLAHSIPQARQFVASKPANLLTVQHYQAAITYVVLFSVFPAETFLLYHLNFAMAYSSDSREY